VSGRSSLWTLAGVVLVAGGAAVLVWAREGWHPIGVVIFLAGVVALFIAFGDWLRAHRPNVD
jgi:hypothetical protein